MKILLLGAELFYADGRTGKSRLMVAFRNFPKAPNNTQLQYLRQYTYCTGMTTLFSQLFIFLY